VTATEGDEVRLSGVPNHGANRMIGFQRKTVIAPSFATNSFECCNGVTFIRAKKAFGFVPAWRESALQNQNPMMAKTEFHRLLQLRSLKNPYF
jgi:hypothetical protein